VPVPEVPAPDLEALPVPAIFAAGMGEGTGSFGCGATTGLGSALGAGAPAGFLACGFGAGGGLTGGGGGACLMSIVVIRSNVSRTVLTLRPVSSAAASAAWTATTAAIAFARSGRVAVPV
jgi:hypothetical protein